MARSIWRKIKDKTKRWRVGILPGIVVISLVVTARLTGTLQFLELVTLDNFLRLRPPEPIEERIVIVGIDEDDIRRVGTYPIPDRELAALLRKLQTYKPAVIGLDIVRDLPVAPGHDELTEAFRSIKNLIGIEKVLPDTSGLTINKPLELPPEQVGFIDVLLDNDGSLRRSLLGTSTPKIEYKYSLSLGLTKTYLSTKGYSLENGTRDRDAMRFGATELTRFQPNSGGYVRADAGGNQILINFRSGQNPFRIVSLNDIKTGKVAPSEIRDRIVLIGITALSAPDLQKSAAVSGVNPGLVYGVQVQAHAVSQIISAVLDGRPLLNVWSDGWEYLWIFAWGFLGISLGWITQSPLKLLLGLVITSFGLAGICYVFILQGWWIPFVSAMFALILNGTGLTALSFYRYDQNLKFQIEKQQLISQERESIIARAANMIHNGPEQDLNLLLSCVQEQDRQPYELVRDLKELRQKLKTVEEYLREETFSKGGIICLDSGLRINAEEPIDAVLYQVYDDTLKRDFPCFKNRIVYLPVLNKIDSQFLSIEQKQGLCRFLQEALINVGKYAQGVTRIEVVCTQEQDQNVIRITDNGIGVDLSRPEGWGTHQAEHLAQQLRGKFKRFPCSTRGTVCELTWPVAKH